MDLDWTGSFQLNPFHTLSGGIPSKCRPGPVLLEFIFRCPVFRRSPIPLTTEPGAA